MMTFYCLVQFMGWKCGFVNLHSSENIFILGNLSLELRIRECLLYHAKSYSVALSY